MDVLEAVKPLLPSWVPWVPLVMAGPGVLLFELAMHMIGEKIGFWPYRRALQKNPDTHWTELAALAWAPRMVLGVRGLLSGLCWGLFLGFSTGPLSAVPAPVIGGIAFATGWMTNFLFARRAGILLGFPRTSFWRSVRSTVAWGWMRLAILTLVLGAAGAATYAVAQGQWAWFLVSLGLLAAIPLNLQLRLGRWIGAVTLPDEQVQRVVQAAARRVGQTPRHTWVLETAVANAFALPITQEILITRRLLEILDESELEGIVHHELGHLQERSAGWLRLVPFFGAVLLGPIAYKTIKVAALIFSPSDIALSHVLQLLGMIVILLIFFGALRFVRRFQQKAEHDADHVAEHAGDPTLYARALEKLYRANLLPAAVKGGVHPSLFDRMQSAGVTPEWPKPAVPGLWPFRVVSLIWLGSLFFYMLAVLLPTAPAWDIALGQNEAWAFDDLGVEASERQDWTTAATYLGAAEQLSDSPWHSYYLIFPLAADGRCQEAEQASQRALERASVHANEWMDADIRDGKQAIADCFLSKSKGAPQ